MYWSRGAAVALFCAATVAIPAQAASGTTGVKPKARTLTLELFSKRVYTRYSNYQDVTLKSVKVLAVGDSVRYADLDYRGTSAKHSASPVGSDETLCVIQSTRGLLCDGTYAFGSSMILADDFILTAPLSGDAVTLTITGGTGTYNGARGTIVATSEGANLNMTFRVRLPAAAD